MVVCLKHVKIQIKIKAVFGVVIVTSNFKIIIVETLLLFLHYFAYIYIKMYINAVTLNSLQYIKLCGHQKIV